MRSMQPCAACSHAQHAPMHDATPPCLATADHGAAKSKARRLVGTNSSAMATSGHE
jgi:hypothetical protein